MVKTIKTIAELKAANKANGGHWFDADTMRFFKSRIESRIIAGNRFVTSEQPPSGPRMYSVRFFREDGSVGTVGEFCRYLTKEDAIEAAKA